MRVRFGWFVLLVAAAMMGWSDAAQAQAPKGNDSFTLAPAVRQRLPSKAFVSTTARNFLVRLGYLRQTLLMQQLQVY